MDNAMYNALKNIPTYSTEGNLRDRGYPSSYDGGIGARVEAKTYDATPKQTTTPKGSSGSSASGATSASGGLDMNAYLEALYAQRQAAAEDAYNRAMSSLNNAYNSASESYANIYNQGVGTLGGAYSNSRNKIDEQATDAMRQAYINRMMSEKNLSQKLAAQGLSGGASESAMAGLINNYGNARNNIQKTWNTNLSDLEQGYNSNLANLYSAYQERMAALDQSRAAQEAQLIENLNNQIASAGSDYFSLLSNPTFLKSAIQSAVGNVQDIQPVAQEVTNTYTPINTQQGNDIGGTLTNWSKIQEQNNLGNGAYETIQKLLERYDPEEVTRMMLYGK